jgi:hypothetical protein
VRNFFSRFFFASGPCLAQISMGEEYINITHALELKHTTLSISCSTLSLRDPFYPFSSKYSFMTKYRKFLSLFTTLNRSNISFSSLQILIIYIEM